MRIREPLRTTSFRIAVAYTALFFVSVLAILGVVYAITATDLSRTLRASITSEIAALRVVYEQNGREGLLADIRRRADNAPDDRFYLLLGPDGQRLAGNLPVEAFAKGWASRRLDDDLIRSSPLLSTILSFDADDVLSLTSDSAELGDMRLMVARETHATDEIQDIVFGALFWGVAATSVLALIGGYVLSFGPTRRVDTIAETLGTILTGKLDVRLPRNHKLDELDRLSADINRMLDQIEALVGSLKQVSTDIAHDLRSPLSRLRQKLERTRERGCTIAEYDAVMDEAIAETDTIIETFNALLRIAQIEAGARKAKFASVDLSGLLNELADVFEPVAEDKGQRFTARIEPGLVVDGDRDLLQQLFANLIENAITHVPASAAIELIGKREANRVVCRVCDDGPGIPEAERRHVFRRLYRLDRSRSTPGSGLGLAMAEAIAELHDATISVDDNAPGTAMVVVFR